MIRESHFSRRVHSYERRSAKLEVDPTSLSKETLFLILFLRNPNLISLVRCNQSVVLLDILTTKSLSNSQAGRMKYEKRSAKLAINPTTLSKRHLFMVSYLRDPNLISLVRYNMSVVLLDTLLSLFLTSGCSYRPIRGPY